MGIGCRFVVAVLLSLSTSLVQAETVAELHEKAKAAFAKGEKDEALALATKAIELEPKNSKTYFFRGLLNDTLRKHTDAVADFTKAIAFDPTFADAYDHRGSAQFMLAHIAESLADFDKFLELKPSARPGHWRRGITCYYAGKFDDGAKQFEGYEQVDTNDVENAVWQYLCVARKEGIEKARSSILKIGNDKRVPLMQVYDLFRGKLKPEDVLTAANAGQPTPAQLNERLFYAHLYLGLYYEAAGDKAKMLEHMKQAAVDHKVTGYMWEVARVHLELRKKH